MMHYYVISKEPGKEVDMYSFTPTEAMIQKLAEKPIFTGKKEGSKFPVFVVKATNRLDAMSIYEDFIHVAPTKRERLREAL